MDEWTVVGGKGRSRKAGASGHEDGRHMQERPCAQPQQTASVAPLPGWSVAGDASAPAHKPKPRRGRNKLMERTPEQVASDLLEQVKQFRQEVEGSSVFTSLQHAFAAAAPHLPVSQQGPAPLQVPDELGDQCARQQLHHHHQHHHQQQQQQQDQVHRRHHSHPQQDQQHHQQHSQRQQDQQPPHPHPPSHPAAGQHTNWQHIKELVVFGLGSMQESITSRYQLALASLLASCLLPGLSSPPIAFDPAFSPADALLLTSMGFQVLESNQQCAHRAHVPTLFYLPHLEGHLCDNLLAANGCAPGPVSGTLSGNTQFSGGMAKFTSPQASGTTAPSPQTSSGEAASPQTNGAVAPSPHEQHHQQPHDAAHQEQHAEVPQQHAQLFQQQQQQQAQAEQQPCNQWSPSKTTVAHCPSCNGTPHPPQCSPTHTALPPYTHCGTPLLPHTLHNCLLLANRFSTYECRCPGPVSHGHLASSAACMSGNISSRSSRIKAKKRGLHALSSNEVLGPSSQGGISHSADSAEGQSMGSKSTAGTDGLGPAQGLKGLIEGGHAPTMLSLLAAGAVLEFHVKEDKRFPAPSAFNDMALHIIPLQQ